MVFGTVNPSFAPLKKALDRQIKKYPGGAAIAAYHNGELVADLWGGVRNAEGDPWEAGTMSVSFSTTKGVASTAIHILADRGLLDYDDNVSKHWPEFAQNGKEDIRIRHILCHESGLYDLRSLIDHADEMLDWERVVTLLAQARPAHAPGAVNAYHGLTYGYLTGELVRRLTGKSFSQFVIDEIAQPLGLDGFYVGAPEHEIQRVARLVGRRYRSSSPSSKGQKRKVPLKQQIFYRGLRTALGVAGLPNDLRKTQLALMPKGIGSFDFSAPQVVQACIPAANGVFTARSLAKLYACLANGGELDGVRLMSRETVEKATRIQNRRPDHVVIVPMTWRMGYHFVGTFRGVSKHAFGHFGYGGSGAFAHPRRNLSFAMTVNSGQGTPFGDLRMARMSGIALACAAGR